MIRRPLDSCNGCTRVAGCALRGAGAELARHGEVQIAQQTFFAGAPIAADSDCLLAVKSVCRDPQGQHRVVTFSFPGELFGLEALAKLARGIGVKPGPASHQVAMHG